tara:strand:+ start:95 stop:253 length:159 start_codon:yes stop_codon:yes gene_type:complete
VAVSGAIDYQTTIHQEQIYRWLSMQKELHASGVSDLSIFKVGIKELFELAEI